MFSLSSKTEMKEKRNLPYVTNTDFDLSEGPI